MKDNILEFYVNKFCFLNSLDNVDINFISPILRRKTSTVDKLAFYTMNSVFSDEIQNIVLSSRFGEVERLLKIINQYILENETSPIVFSASVHNFPVGFFLFNIKKNIPYTALSAMNASISSGLVTSIVSKCDNTLFCYCDANNDELVSLSLNISKKPKENSIKFRLHLQNDDNIKDNFNNFISLLKGEINSFDSPFFKIERITK